MISKNCNFVNGNIKNNEIDPIVRLTTVMIEQVEESTHLLLDVSKGVNKLGVDKVKKAHVHCGDFPLKREFGPTC